MCYYVCLPKTESKPNIWSWLEGDIHSPQWLWGTKSAAATVTRRVDFIPASAKTNTMSILLLAYWMPLIKNGVILDKKLKNIILISIFQKRN